MVSGRVRNGVATSALDVGLDATGALAAAPTAAFAPPPELPDDIPWPDRTVAWWEMWTKSPQADELGPTDWDFLLDTALLHADVWSGNLDRMPELRIRVAKFGATPEDRVRLKIQYATLEVGEDAAERAGERRQARRERVPKKDDPRELLREA